MNTTPSHQGTFITRWLALITLSVPVAYQAMWQVAANTGNNQAERVRIFMGYFGGLYGKTFQITATSLLMCLVTIVVAGYGAGRTTGLFRTINNVCLVIAALLLMLNLFSLM